jgi:TPP-dependent pyruvate/acetoin dehydrogenase alpha subunit
LIYVCENNYYTQFTNSQKLISGEGLAARARVMGMKGVEVDGNDVLAVYQAAHELVEVPLR